MSSYIIPRQLKELLIELYTTVEESKRVVEDAQMVWTHVKFSNTAVVNWHEILVEAHRRRKVIDILNIAAQDYNERILDVAQVKLLLATYHFEKG